jgi:hypothetical protein
MIFRTMQLAGYAGRNAPLAAFLLLAVLAQPAAADSAAGDLRDAYQEFRQQHGMLAPDINLSIHTRNKGSRIWTEVYGTVHGKFTTVSQALLGSRGYCEFLPPLFNLKSCVSARVDGRDLIRFYVGSKHYTSMLRTILIVAELQRVSERPDYVHVRLASVDAASTKYGYRIDIEVVPFGDDVLARVRTYYNPDRLTRIAVSTYLHTVGENKVGFTRVAVAGQDKTAYVGGMSGVIERNTVRAFMAMQAYLDTVDAPLAGRYSERLQRWFALTDRFRRQLHELGRREYISVKMRERLQQLRMQKHADRHRDP